MNLKHYVAKLIEKGLPLPHAYDPVPKVPSFRLLAAYLSFLLALGSNIALHFFAIETATWTAIVFFAICMVFYMLKRLTKASIDLDDKSVSLESDEKSVD
jgi:hypothetical protein